MGTGNVGGLASGIVAAAGLTATALRYRNLPMALASAVSLAAVQIELIDRTFGTGSARSVAIVVLVLGAAEIGGVAVIGASRGVRALPAWPLPGAPQQYLFSVALLLALFSLAIPSTGVPSRVLGIPTADVGAGSLAVNRSPVPPITAPLPTFLLPPQSPPGPQPPATSATSTASLPLLPAIVPLMALP
ncbi:MAG: hypothetical protein E6J03_01800 [Chloroflexi bacterium]|nr:MAG: hypothetical protein E6J03_01800 [Chloroflexota bacterium]